MRPSALALTLCLLVPALPAAAASLCAGTETEVFSCGIGHKTVSLCAAGKVLTYRFGTPAKVEMTYPTDGTPAARGWTAGFVGYSGGGATWARFSRGAYAYTVFSGIGRWGANEEAVPAGGIIVENGDGPVANLPCTRQSKTGVDGDALQALGVPFDDQSDFQIPEAFLPPGN